MRNSIFRLVGAVALVAAAACSSSGSSSDTTAPPLVPDTIRGTVTLPAGAIGKCVLVALDDDADPSNGVMLIGADPLIRYGVAAATSYAYEFAGLPAGAYYLFTVVDLDGNFATPAGGCVPGGSPPSVGDLFGYYGLAGLESPSTPSVTLPLTSNATFDITPTAIPPSTAAGMVTVPAGAIGKCALVALDDDADPSNGVAQVGPDFLVRYAEVTSTTLDFEFANLPDGSYYLFTVVDMDGSNASAPGCVFTGAPNAGDLFGYYGASGLQTPADPTVNMPPRAALSYDITPTVIPPSSAAGTVTVPAGANGKCALVALDDDADPSNGVAVDGGGQPIVQYAQLTSTSLAFEFTGLAAGGYYLFALVDMDGSNGSAPGCVLTGAPTSGDLFGFHGTSGFTAPAAPTVTMPPTAVLTFDFGVVTIP